ncbi:apoptosis regulator BAX isoform X3 [Pteropus medius]|nr:apoptosis regulator BAX isoform X3 [Pteropus giganteus]
MGGETPELALEPRGPQDASTKKLSECLKRIGDELDSNMELQRMIAAVDTDSPREVFFRVASEMFSDGNFNWGRVVALFYFASKLVLKGTGEPWKVCEQGKFVNKIQFTVYEAHSDCPVHQSAPADKNHHGLDTGLPSRAAAGLDPGPGWLGRPSLLLWDTHVADSDHSCDRNAHCLTNRYLEEDGLRPPAALDYVFCINYGIFLGGVGIGDQGHFSYFCNYWGWDGEEWSGGGNKPLWGPHFSV